LKFDRNFFQGTREPGGGFACLRSMENPGTESGSSLWSFLFGGAALGVIAGAWDKIKAVVWRIANLFIQQVEIPTHAGHDAVVSYLIAKYPRSRYYDRLYAACYEHMRDGRYGLVAYEEFGKRSILFWSGWWPMIFANAEKKKDNKSAETPAAYGHHHPDVFSTLTFLRGTIDVEEIFREACMFRNNASWAVDDDHERRRFCIRYFPERDESDGSDTSHDLAWYHIPRYRVFSHQPDDLGKAPTHPGRSLDFLVFPEHVRKQIREIEQWQGSKDWYRRRGLPWKRGWLLFGPPGTGKTALARAFAEDLNMPIYVFNLAVMSNSSLLRAWVALQANVPCIALLEDIDNVFHGRENVSRKHMTPMWYAPKKEDSEEQKAETTLGPPLTFDCLLNCLDGVDRADGIFTIITTNDISKIDPALGQPRRLPDGGLEFISTRPGRIDKAIELGYMKPTEMRLLAERILADYPDELDQIFAFIEMNPGLKETPAQFQERCSQIALARYWNQQQPHFGYSWRTLDTPPPTAEPTEFLSTGI
jgi:hypothetical protein